MDSLWVWLGIAAVCGIVELFTLELIFIMFAAGSIGAGVSGALGAGTPVQILVAAVISAVGLFVVRPIGMRFIKKSTPETLSNVDALIGQPVRIMSTVSEDAGTVSINGETWSARPRDQHSEFTVGMQAVVDHIDGAYLVIAPPQSTSSDTQN